MANIFFLDPCSSVLKALSQHYLSRGIHIVDDASRSDVIVSSNLKALLKQSTNENQRLLLWTNEPRWSSHVDDSVIINGRPISVMNCYTGDVYVDIFHYLWVGKYQRVSYLTPEEYKSRSLNGNPPAFFMASNHGNGEEFRIDGKNIDLYKFRDEFSLWGNKAGLVHIYGQGWPSGVARTESREGQGWDSWEKRKLEIAKSYLFCICVENTNIKNYVTEKFWHSIMSKSIPIYYSGDTTILDNFDESCMINAANFQSYEEIFNKISSIKQDEHLSMINSLIDQFNQYVSNSHHLQNSRNKIANCFADKVISLAI
jgi:hypothetical protein